MNINEAKNIRNYFLSHQEVVSHMDTTQIQKAALLIHKKIIEGKNIFTMGNGGSAHTASHFITDWNKMSNIMQP